jgi:hypothetical protein
MQAYLMFKKFDLDKNNFTRNGIDSMKVGWYYNLFWLEKGTTYETKKI